MAIEVTPRLSEQSGPLYATFSRRLRAIVIDWALVMAGLVALLFSTIAIQNDAIARTLGILFIVAVLAYEPLAVWLSGNTLGHYLSNLRVVDEKHGGNPSLGKSIARAAIKFVLGAYSFVTMTATRRNQALHDVITKSTVRIRDSSIARPHHYISERAALPSTGTPSRWRRIAITFIYLVGVFAFYSLIAAGLIAAGVLSKTCANFGRCSSSENVINIALAVVYLTTLALCVGLGWRGRLPGARIKP
jgi:uncharacterized RDD family membrane protein YckC